MQTSKYNEYRIKAEKLDRIMASLLDGKVKHLTIDDDKSDSFVLINKDVGTIEIIKCEAK